MLNRLAQWLTVVCASALVVSCGGGGSGSCQLANCGSTPPTPTPSYTLTFSPVDPLTDAAFDNVNGALVFGKTVRVDMKLADKDGNPVPGVIVEGALSNTTVASLSSSGLVLTDGAGTGSFTLSVNSPSASGAVTLTATATINGATSGSSATVTQALSFRINETRPDPNQPAPAPAFLQYVSTTPTRLFVKNGGAGTNNAAEEAIVSFKVLDANNGAVPGATVVFDVTKRSGGVLTNGSAVPSTVVSDSGGVARVTVASGTQPLSLNVIAWLPSDPTKTYLSNDQIVISSRRPNQTNFFIQWTTGATCGTAAPRTYPCQFVVNVGDENGQPVADGTVVNLVSDTGVVVATQLAGQPSGACLTVSSKCSAEYTGRSGVGIGSHRIVAYSVGDQAPPNKPITLDGSWNAAVGVVKVPVPDSDNYIRSCITDYSDPPAPNTCQSP